MADITVVGGVNVDIQGSKDKLIYKDSNIGNVNISLVGREEYRENLVKLGFVLN